MALKRTYTIVFIILLFLAPVSLIGQTEKDPNAGSKEFPVSNGMAVHEDSKPHYYNTVLLCIIILFSIQAILLIVVNIIKKNPDFHFVDCPNCKSIRLRRIRRTYLNVLFSFFLIKSRIKRYRCTNCKWEGIKVID